MARILLIEDSTDTAEMLCAALAAEGHEVVHSANGSDGIALARHGKFELVITDIMLPGVDGFTVIETLHENRPDLPIIAMSGGGRALPANVAVSGSRALGADEVFFKPLDIARFLDAVRRLT